ncbi:DUF1648 domain-containing protein [Flagellimonas lutaonensis]|uniref:DUF1648 domain-containing protein n=1 Tax=Flagellimonas lutaonensis TaxID=516051 RepID=A0A0D5YR82_9FLAO|nr:DUF1648 domain-containing protein [Allomuricauda lutaonensis]AKA34393.1 hypothetical protein VC82_731 [Allomuricauda lutaonensis]
MTFNMFRKQPQIEVKPTETDKKIIIAGWLLTAVHLITVLSFYATLPKTIPIHFNLMGEPDAYGHKSTLWIIPVLNLILYYGMTQLVTKLKPWKFNYPVRVTEKNAPRLYGMNIRMMVLVNLGISALFFVVTLHTIAVAKSFDLLNLGWLILVLLATLTLMPFWYILKMFKLPKE